MIKVLAIGAHPDDIELGCAGTLLKHRKNGTELYLFVLTKGEASGDPRIRERECQKSAKLMKAVELFFGEMNDTEINDGVKTIVLIEDIINLVNPDIIYTHSSKDTHQDHRNASNATLSAARRCNKIFFYETPTTYKNFLPQVYVDIEREFDTKKKIIRLFSSQSEKIWWAAGDRAAMAVEGLAAYRGYQAGVRVAEAFEVGKLVIGADEVAFSNKSL